MCCGLPPASRPWSWPSGRPRCPPWTCRCGSSPTSRSTRSRSGHRARAGRRVRRRGLRPAMGHARALARAGRSPRRGERGRSDEPFPGHYDPAQLPCCARRWRRRRRCARTLARLAPPALGVDPALVASVNTPEDLAAAERRACVSAPDFAVVGGGIVGCALAAFLAEGGARGRALRARGDRRRRVRAQLRRRPGPARPCADRPLRGVARATTATLGAASSCRRDPAGLLLLSDEPLEPPTRRRRCIEDPRAARAGAQPTASSRCRLETGRPVPPAAAAHASAPARTSGARSEDRPELRAADGADEPARAMHRRRPVDPGPGRRSRSPPCGASWSSVELPDAPRHVLEEAGIDALTSEDVPDVLFSAVTARGISAIGSTFMPEQPDPEALAPRDPRQCDAVPPGISGVRCAACGRARGRARPTGGRCWAASRRSSTWPAATERGGSRSGRRRRGSSRISCWAAGGDPAGPGREPV